MKRVYYFHDVIMKHKEPVQDFAVILSVIHTSIAEGYSLALGAQAETHNHTLIIHLFDWPLAATKNVPFTLLRLFRLVFVQDFHITK